MPHFDLTCHQRLTAALAGAQEITDEEAAALAHLWQAHSDAALTRLATSAAEHPAFLPHPATKATGTPKAPA